MSARDPVCGKEVDPLRARAVGIFGGVTYFFCSPDCKAKYADPRARGESAPVSHRPERRKRSSAFAAAPTTPPTDSPVAEEKIPGSPSGAFLAVSDDATPLPPPLAAASLADEDETDEAPASGGLPWRYIVPALAVGAIIAAVLVLHR